MKRRKFHDLCSIEATNLRGFFCQYRDNPRYELADGELVDRSPTGPHETVGGKLATQIGIAIRTYAVKRKINVLISGEQGMGNGKQRFAAILNV